MYIGDDLPPTLQIDLERLIMDFINIGSTPAEEDCFGVGNPLWDEISAPLVAALRVKAA